MNRHCIGYAAEGGRKFACSSTDGQRGVELVVGLNWYVSNARSRTYQCVACVQEHGSYYRARNAGKEKTRCERWRAAHADKAAERKARWRATPAGRASDCECSARRHAAKLRRTPHWSERERIEEFYSDAELFTRSFRGGPFAVDHILPLQGDTVSGLHVAGNLAVIPQRLNSAKNNRLDWTSPAPSFERVHINPGVGNDDHVAT